MPVFRAKHFSYGAAGQPDAGSARSMAARSTSGAAKANISPDDTAVYLQAAKAMNKLAMSLPEIAPVDVASRIPEVVDGLDDARAEAVAAPVVEDVAPVDVASRIPEILDGFDGAVAEAVAAPAAEELAPEPFVGAAEDVAEPVPGAEFAPADELAYEAESAPADEVAYEAEAVGETYPPVDVEPAFEPDTLAASGMERETYGEEDLDGFAAAPAAVFEDAAPSLGDEGPYEEQLIHDEPGTLPDEGYPLPFEEPEALPDSWEAAGEGDFEEEVAAWPEESLPDQEGQFVEPYEEPLEAADDEVVPVDVASEDEGAEAAYEAFDEVGGLVEAEGSEEELDADLPEQPASDEDLAEENGQPVEDEPFVDLPPLEVSPIEAPQAVVFGHADGARPEGEWPFDGQGPSGTVMAPVRYDSRLTEGRAMEDLGEAIEAESAIPVVGLRDSAPSSSAQPDQQFNMEALLVAAAAALVIVGGTILLITHPWDPGSRITHTETEQQIDISEVGSIEEIDSLSGQDNVGVESDSQQTAAQATFDQLSTYFQRILQLRDGVAESDELLRASLDTNNADVVDAGLENAFQLSVEITELCDQIDATDTSAGVYVEERNTLSELANWLRNWSDTLVEGWNALDTAEGEDGIANARAVATRDDENGVNSFQTLLDEGIAQFTLTEASGDEA